MILYITGYLVALVILVIAAKIQDKEVTIGKLGFAIVLSLGSWFTIISIIVIVICLLLMKVDDDFWNKRIW